MYSNLTLTYKTVKRADNVIHIFVTVIWFNKHINHDPSQRKCSVKRASKIRLAKPSVCALFWPAVNDFKFL
jgi:hypothetical protein